MERQGIIKELERMKKVPTKHEGCVLDDAWCYGHHEMMKDEDYPNGANSYNKAIEDIIRIIFKN